MGSVLGEVTEGRITNIFHSTTVRPLKVNNLPQFHEKLSLDHQAIQAAAERDTWIECEDCKKWRKTDDEEVLSKEKFVCKDLPDVTCADVQDLDAWRGVVVDNEVQSHPSLPTIRKEIKQNKPSVKILSSGVTIKKKPRGRPPANKVWSELQGKYIPKKKPKAGRAVAGLAMALFAGALVQQRHMQDAFGKVTQSTHESYVNQVSGNVSKYTWETDWEEVQDKSATPKEPDDTCLVYKEITANEAASRPEFDNVVKKEVSKFFQDSVLGFPEKFEDLPTNAKKFKTRVLYGIKGQELETALQKDKARMITEGNISFDARGNISVEKTTRASGSYWAPTGALSSCRLISAFSAICGAVIQTVDLINAYLQVAFKDPDVYIELHPSVLNMLPEVWRVRAMKTLKLSKIGRIAFPVHKALYGIGRSGMDFIEGFHKSLTDLSWKPLTQDGAIFYKFYPTKFGRVVPVLLLTYVDDLLLSIPPGVDGVSIWSELKVSWNFELPKDSCRFIGIDIQQNSKGIKLCQKDYMKSVVSKYEDFSGKVLTSRKTLPAIEYEGRNDENVPKEKIPKIARSIIGGLMYGARGTRPDICRATNHDASFTHNGSMEILSYMEGILTYLKGKIYNLFYKNIPTDSIDDWDLCLYADANYKAPASVSGHALCLVRRQTGEKHLIDWSSKGQGMATLSTTEAELISLVRGIKNAISWLDTMAVLKSKEHVEDPSVVPVDPLLTYTDNYSAMLAARRGYSKCLTHTPRAYGISAQWAKEKIDEGLVEVAFIGTKFNLDYSLTKIALKGGPIISVLNVDNIFRCDIDEKLFIKDFTYLKWFKVVSEIYAYFCMIIDLFGFGHFYEIGYKTCLFVSGYFYKNDCKQDELVTNTESEVVSINSNRYSERYSVLCFSNLPQESNRVSNFQ